MNDRPVNRVLRSESLPLVVIGLAWAWLCWDLILGRSVVAFRDSGYLYFPLFQAIEQVWSQGKIPMWNPVCNFGFATIADGSSSVFYPGKLLFFLPGASYPSRYGLYLSIHLLIAALGTYRLARGLKTSRPGATLAALSFAFGGPVLVQVANAIYLVSAAWLPWALWFCWLMFQRSDRRAAVLAGVCCSLMILGGDPQMVYHVGLIAAATLLVRVFFHRSKVSLHQTEKSIWQVWVRPTGCLLIMVLVTTGLSAIQLLPTAELAQRSERVAEGAATDLYSALWHWSNHTQTDPFAGLVERDDQIVGQYQFSQPPWSLIELVLPNVSGRAYPENSRWVDQLASADRMWYPSLYIGCLVALLAIAGVRFWGQQHRTVWLSWIALVFLLASFGWYGGAWLWRELLYVLTGSVSSAENTWAAPVGGVYWWMSIALPEYHIFRYPAKLLMVASLCFSLLAGQGLVRFAKVCQPNAGPILFGTLMVTVAAGLAVEWFARSPLENLALEQAESAETLSLFGPWTPDSAMSQIHGSILHVGLVGVLLAIAARLTLKFRNQRAAKTLAWWLVLLTAAELVIANAWLLSKVPAEAFNPPNSPSDVVTPWPAPTSITNLQPVPASGTLPTEFLVSSSPDRLTELVRWQIETGQPKYHLLQGKRRLGSFHSIWPTQYQSLVDRAKATETWGSNFTPDASATLEIESGTVEWNQASLNVKVSDSGWQTLPIFGDRNWQVKATGKDRLTLQPEQRISPDDLLQIQLPTGEYKIQLQYQPVSFYLGATITAITLFGLVGIGMSSVLRRRRNDHLGS